MVHSSTQQPHIVRSGLAECLGIDEGQIRVIAPDVGGGFGYKGILLPEEVALAWATRKLRRLCVGWRIGARGCRPMPTAASTTTSSPPTPTQTVACWRWTARPPSIPGAYSAYPFSACLEAGQIGSILPGVYDFPHYRCRTYSVATNKPPILPYRGVARTGVCFALEVTLEALARQLGIEATDFAAQQPGPARADAVRQYHQAAFRLRRLSRGPAARHQRHRSRPGARSASNSGREDGRRIGVGFAMYSEQAGHGTSVYAAWGIPFVPGHEQCLARFTPDGALELRIGAHSHGQGLETTLSQVAHSILGVPHDRIRLVHGDTARTPYSTGTWGSRSMIMSGGAVAAACDQLAERLIRIGATLLQAKRGGRARSRRAMMMGPSGRMAIAEVARMWYRRPQDLPPDVDPAGLEVTAGYKAKRDTGTFSYAAHAAVVAVDADTGRSRSSTMSSSKTAACWSIR